MSDDAERNVSCLEARHRQKDLMDLVKGNGPWQWSILIVALLCAIPDGSNNFSMTFIAPNVDHWCSRPPGTNISVQYWEEFALPPDDKQCSRSEGGNASRETIYCDSWEYDDSIYSSTIVSQWNLVCDREWLISMSKSIFIAGVFLSSTLFAYLSDKFGRKPLVLVSNVLAIVGGTSCIFSSSFLMFAISRFFVAAAVSAADHAATVLMIEIVSPEYRSPYYCGISLAWIAGALHLPLIAWWLRDWISIELVLILPSVLLLATWWLLPESPRWLLAQNKAEEALEILSKAAKRNGMEVSDNKLKEMVTNLKESNDDKNTGIRVLDLFKSELRLRTFVMWFIWCATTFTYYGISYNTNELAGNPFINFALYFAIEIPSTILVLIVIQYKGRRSSLAVGLAVAGVACLLVYPIPEDLVWMRTLLSLFGKFCISATFALLGLFTTEVFPTHLRNTGYGSASAVARFAAILAPFVRELGRSSHPLIPQILFGSVSITGGGLALLLPETTNCSVPDTCREAAEISRKTSFKKPSEKTWILNDLKNRKDIES
ncbi:Solute carrier family 22 member 5 [Araneus ventricosus]|uniref:Solute carrier family 22 member 5 n=1 Tax=Araneus ventricosus TaxID=182803 RepID=A0A4Y2K1B2_ARAVE|nr:Solute carrier family 22 member 5 [Araneus ventricosus]